MYIRFQERGYICLELVQGTTHAQGECVFGAADVG